MKKIIRDGKTITLFSTDEVEKVEIFIKKNKHVKLFLGIDKKRLSLFSHEWNDKEISEVISEGKSYILLHHLLDTIDGKEYMHAIELAMKNNIDYEFVDEDYNETVKKTFSSIPTEVKVSMLVKAISGRKVKLRSKIIDKERAKNIADRILSSKEKKIIAILDKNHIQDTIKSFNKKNRKINSNNSNMNLSFLKYVIPFFLSGAMLYGAYSLGIEMAGQILVTWIVLNFVFAAIGALISLAHPVTILVAGLVSPITSFIPVLPAGLVAAYTESKIRKPIVKDVEGLRNIKMKDAWNNRISKLGLIFVLVNIGSATAAYLSVVYAAFLFI